jgi:hypothetical protein
MNEHSFSSSFSTLPGGGSFTRLKKIDVKLRDSYSLALQVQVLAGCTPTGLTPVRTRLKAPTPRPWGFNSSSSGVTEGQRNRCKMGYFSFDSPIEKELTTESTESTEKKSISDRALIWEGIRTRINLELP